MIGQLAKLMLVVVFLPLAVVNASGEALAVDGYVTEQNFHEFFETKEEYLSARSRLETKLTKTLRTRRGLHSMLRSEVDRRAIVACVRWPTLSELVGMEIDGTGILVRKSGWSYGKISRYDAILSAKRWCEKRGKLPDCDCEPVFLDGKFQLTKSAVASFNKKLPTSIPNEEDKLISESFRSQEMIILTQDDDFLCRNATFGGQRRTWFHETNSYVKEAKRRGLSCGVGETTQTASAPKATPKVTSAALIAAEKEAERLRKELAALKAKQQQQQQVISNDTTQPRITIASVRAKGKQGIILGKARDNIGIAEVNIDGKQVGFDISGIFEFETFVPVGGKEVTIQVTDLNGLSNSKTVKLDRSASADTASIAFESLNPLGRKVTKNRDALALIIGIEKYKNTVDAAYADKDALMFRDYATEKLGIPSNRIKTLINNEADISGMLLGVRKWLRRSSKPNESDVYVFYAGHGITTPDREAYLFPYDGVTEVLDRTALLQKDLFSEIEKANPRNVTIFLDACYTGKARTGEVLMADAELRPIAIRPIDDGLPDNFTLFAASSGSEFSGPLKEVKQGMFSYYLMKGMEGEADSNQDNKITVGELHSYVQQNVVQQSSGSQTPELKGDADRVLVRFQ